MPKLNIFQDFPGIDFADAFHCEAKRLTTFKNWQHTHRVSLCTLAKEGFHSKEINTTVVCHFCQLIIRVSSINAPLIEYHRFHSPNCPIFSSTDNNIPLPKSTSNINCSQALDILFGRNSTFRSSVQERTRNDAGDTTTNDVGKLFNVILRSPDLPFTKCLPLTAEGSVAFTAQCLSYDDRFPKYSLFGVRIRTFRNFPAVTGLCVKDLANLGFFCLGKYLD